MSAAQVAQLAVQSAAEATVIAAYVALHRKRRKRSEELRALVAQALLYHPEDYYPLTALASPEPLRVVMRDE